MSVNKDILSPISVYDRLLIQEAIKHWCVPVIDLDKLLEVCPLINNF